MALDIYAWLAYRLHVLKAQFLTNLRLALAVYRDAKVEVEDTGLVLHPSRPPVAPKPLAMRG
jgi:hypothetical protein